MKYLPDRIVRSILFGAGIVVAACPSFGEIETVSTLTVLEGKVNVAWTNSEMAKIMPPGIEYDNDLGVYAYASGFSSNFINGLVPETNGSVVSYFVRVSETNAATRYRFYYNLADECVHTTDVFISGYPEDWIEDVYGEAPDWLSGSSLDEWYGQRDPSRQEICYILIATNDTTDYLTRMTNAVPPWEEGGTNQTLLDLYSNDIAFVQIKTASSGVELYVHAPTNVAVLDIYRSTNLFVSTAWTLPATLDFISDPLLWLYSGPESNAFFMAADPTVDTDGDGLGDAREVRLFGTSASLRDSDGDGIDDGTEIMQYGLSARSTDSDGDGISDADEIAQGTNPNAADSDGDGLTDYAEIYTYWNNVNPLDADSDDDGLSDYEELVTYGTYPREDDTDSDEMEYCDPTNDKEEIDAGTSPLLADTDADGIPDSYELDQGWSPTNSANASQDDDNDGFSNLIEYQWDTTPDSFDDEFPDTQVIIRRRPGVNGIRGWGLDFLYTAAVGDWGTNSSLIRIRPYQVGSNLVAQCLHHEQPSGIYINGTEASSLSSPITIPASSNAVEFKITADVDAAVTKTCFELKDTNGNRNCGLAYFCVPKLDWVEFSQAKVCNYVRADYGENTNLWIAMPQQTNDCRLYMHLDQTEKRGYGMPNLWKTDWVLAKITGDGSDPAATTLNYLDYTSAWGPWSDTKHTQGVRLNPGTHYVEVGFDMNGNGTLEPGEVQAACSVHVAKADIDVDADNDGSTTDADEAIENVLPGKLIFADKDAYWRDGVTNSQIIAVDLDFDMGGSTVPSNAYVVLEWFDSFGALSYVDVYEDATCTTELSRTFVYDPDGYDIYCGLGHVYGPGDTVPDVVYVRASSSALKPSSDNTRTIVHDTLSLVCHRLDTEDEICRDDVKVSICNTPAVSPKGKTLEIWLEEYTEPSTYATVQFFEGALEDDSAGDGMHTNPYPAEYFRASSNSTTVANFEDLADASIVLTAVHGGAGYVYPVAYPETPEGWTNAFLWAADLGTNWATPKLSPYDCYWVRVKTSYFENQWKATRNANDAMLFAVTCHAAKSNSAAGLPSYIESVGGEFATGYTNSGTASAMTTKYIDIAKRMRDSKWRTANGAFEIQGMADAGYRMAGDGKVTLWPAPLEGSEVACYPKEHCEEGTAAIVFDTGLHNKNFALTKLSGDADMTGVTPAWFTYAGTNCGLRWPYTKDTSAQVKTVIRARADKCYTPYTGAVFSGKNLAGDGESCGRNREWGDF